MEARSDSSSRERVLVLVSLILGVSFVLSVLVVAATFYRIKMRPDTLTATGSIRERITSDAAKWAASFSRTTQNRNLKDAGVAMERDLKTVLDYLKRHGIEEKDLAIFPVGAQQQYEPVKSVEAGGYINKPTEYSLQQRFQLESNDVRKITQIAQGISSLLGEGVFISTEYAQYFYTQLPELRVRLLEGAVRDARRRANAIAQNGGARLGKLKSVSTGVIQLLPPNSTEVSDYGRYDTSTIEKEAMATVRATFILR